MPPDPARTSNYLQYLPAIFSEKPFLGRFLLAFEQVLTGLEEAESEPKRGLEETIAQINKLFDPSEITEVFDPNNPAQKETLQDFLRWLEGWTVLSLRADWTLEQQRAFLANIIPLYRRRGTKENLTQLLKIYTGGLEPIITEPEDTPFQIGVHSTVGVDTQIGGSIPHYFQVYVKIPSLELETLKRQRQIVSALIDLQKPAHTYYDLAIEFRTMQIGVRSTIGENTILGSIPDFETLQIGVYSTVGEDTILGQLPTET